MAVVPGLARLEMVWPPPPPVVVEPAELAVVVVPVEPEKKEKKIMKQWCSAICILDDVLNVLVKF